MFPSEQWIINEPLLASVGRLGIAMALDGPPGNVMNISELHWSLSTGTLFSVSVSKIYRLFLQDMGGNNGFSLENSGGQPQFSREILR